MVGVDTVNGRSYVDVTYTLPSYASSLDTSSVTDLAPEFTIAPANPSDGTIALDSTQAPILMSQTATTYTYRYFTTGTLHGANAVLTYIGGSVSFVDTAGQSIPLFASGAGHRRQRRDAGPVRDRRAVRDERAARHGERRRRRDHGEPAPR